MLAFGGDSLLLQKSDNYSGYSVVGKGGAIPESAVGRSF